MFHERASSQAMCARPHTSNMVAIVDRPLTTLLSSRPPLFAPLPSDAVCRMHHVRSPPRHHKFSFVRELFRLALFRDGSTVRCTSRCEKRLPCIKVSLLKPGHREPNEALISGLSWRSEPANQATMLGSYSSRLSPSCDSPLTRHQINSLTR